MADREFEQFTSYFDKLPQYIKAPAHSYTLVHDVGLDENLIVSDEKANDTGVSSASSCSSAGDSSVNEVDDDEYEIAPSPPPPPVRRRRKLPEIPKNKKSSVLVLSLADELGQVTDRLPPSVQLTLRNLKQPVGAFQLTGDREDISSSSESNEPIFNHSLDGDSGHSTTNSPDGRRPASISSFGLCCSCVVSSAIGAGGAEYHDVSRLVATHRGLHKFIPRHRDEIQLEIGDPIYVQRECDDLWCEGVNLRTGRQGTFPSAYAIDLEYREFDPEAETDDKNNTHDISRRDRFLLDYMGSIETLYFKGNAVLMQAVKRISAKSTSARAVILEVSDLGIRMLGRDRHVANKDGENELDYFYSLKNVSFCSFHPRDQRYLGFITKHPQRQRFACHVFRGDESMRPVAETIGRAFERFYQKFLETTYPTEDIYIE